MRLFIGSWVKVAQIQAHLCVRPYKNKPILPMSLLFGFYKRLADKRQTIKSYLDCNGDGAACLTS
jgi:hypothetical protein